MIQLSQKRSVLGVLVLGISETHNKTMFGGLVHESNLESHFLPKSVKTRGKC